VAFVADEYDCFLTEPADSNFLSKCREARCCSLIATQSYESIAAKLHDQHSTNKILANLRTKLWLCCEDVYTAEQAANLCGKIEREKTSRNRSESSGGGFSLFDRRFVAADSGNWTESYNVSLHEEFMFAPRVFLNLYVNQCVAKVFDGQKVIPARVLYLKPTFKDPNISWFDYAENEEARPSVLADPYAEGNAPRGA
jgi:hypothetical protein